MSILLTKDAQEKLKKRDFQSQVSLKKLSARLQSIDINSLKDDPSIRRVAGVDEEIYVLRINSVRVFLTTKDNDVVILSIEHG